MINRNCVTITRRNTSFHLLIVYSLPNETTVDSVVVFYSVQSTNTIRHIAMTKQTLYAEQSVS